MIRFQPPRNDKGIFVLFPALDFKRGRFRKFSGNVNADFCNSACLKSAGLVVIVFQFLSRLLNFVDRDEALQSMAHKKIYFRVAPIDRCRLISPAMGLPLPGKPKRDDGNKDSNTKSQNTNNQICNIHQNNSFF
jgi:hypothetical protein